MYNCADQIGRVIRQCETSHARMARAGIDITVLLVDNRSRDDTLERACAALDQAPFPVWCLRNDANYGLGGSHKVAIGFALEHGFDWLVVLHGDDQGSLADLVPWLETGAHLTHDALLGARFQKGARLEGYSRLRIWANRAFNLVFSVVAGRRLYDLGSGLNLFRTIMFRDRFDLRLADDLTFNYYLILVLAARGADFRFFPITWREDGQVSNARLFSQGLRMLRLLANRITDKNRFVTGEHRKEPRGAYPSTCMLHRVGAPSLCAAGRAA